MAKLTDIWDQIGIVGEQRESRRDVVLLHVNNLLDEMVHEEDTLKDKLVENVKKFGIELMRLCTELNIPVYEVCIHFLTY